MPPDPSFNSIIVRLTALWALCESGLGGWMHALRLPFTGFFVGGAAVMIISLIAYHSSNKSRDILRATLLVIAIKAAVSPHSPPPAYLAVAFQGVLGAFIFSLPRPLAAYLFGMLSMLESAWQKIITATILYGKSLWQATDILFASILKDFHFAPDTSYSSWIIGAYSLIYMIWGLVLGHWMIRLPAQIEKHAAVLGQLRVNLPVHQVPRHKKRHFLYKWIPVFLSLLVIAAVFLFVPGKNQVAVYVVLRTIAILAVFLFVVRPLFSWIMHRWLRKAGSIHAAELREITDMLPELRSHMLPAYQIAKMEKGAIRQFRLFILGMIVFTLILSDERR
ncbi:MAG: hypothetical protein EOP49_12315 [Sphingobacteriales bacterium]|nr:MAG: hypothetical protein EOP49_12315 [Sphingobacteriales bacterium]